MLKSIDLHVQRRKSHPKQKHKNIDKVNCFKIVEILVKRVNPQTSKPTIPDKIFVTK